MIDQEKLESVDTTRIRLINEIVNHEQNHDLNLVVDYAFRGLSLSKKLKDIPSEGSYYITLAKAHGMRGFLDSSHHYLQLFFPLVEKEGETLNEGYGQALMFSGIIAEQKGQFEQAIEFYQKADSLNIKSIAGNIKINLGAVHMRMDKNELSIKYFEEALELVEGTPSELELTHNIAKLHAVMGNTKKVDFYVQKLLTSARKLDDPFHLAHAINMYLSNIDNLILENLDLLDEGFQIVKEHNLINLRSAYLLHYAYVKTLNNNPENAIQDLQKIGEKSINDNLQLISFLHLNAVNLMGLEKYNKALSFNERSIELSNAQKNGKVDHLFYDEIHRLNFMLHEKLGNYKKAYQVSQKYYSHKDSLDYQNNQEQVAQLDAQLRDIKMEKELTILTKDKQLLVATNNNYKMMTSGIGLFSIISLGFLWILRKRNKEIQIQNQKLEKLNYTKDQIFSIIGHDLRNPALSFRGISKKVRHLLKKRDYDTLDAIGERIERNAHSLNKLIDNLLKWALMQKEVLPYKPTKLNLNNITSEVITVFETMAQDKNIAIINNIPPPLMVFADEAGLHTILRNLVDNAIKYSPKEGGEIQLIAEEKDNMISIKIKDQGIGMSSEMINDIFILKGDKSKKGTAGEKGTGLGLHLISELVNMNKGIINVTSQIGVGTEFKVLLLSPAIN